MAEEWLDLVDKNGVPTGVKFLRGSQMPEGMYRQICDIWIVNKKGEVLMQRRSMQKKNCPGSWCSAAGGALQSGESVETGCIRETEEEIGITPDWSRGGKVFEFLSPPHYHHVFLFVMDVKQEDMRFQEEEVMDARYATPDEIRRMHREGTFMSTGYLEQLLQMLPVLISAYGGDN